MAPCDTRNQKYGSTIGGQFVTGCQTYTPRKRARAEEISAKARRLGVCLGFDYVFPCFC